MLQQVLEMSKREAEDAEAQTKQPSAPTQNIYQPKAEVNLADPVKQVATVQPEIVKKEVIEPEQKYEFLESEKTTEPTPVSKPAEAHAPVELTEK